MKKQILVFIVIILTACIFAACNNHTQGNNGNEQEVKERVIQDMSGTDVTIPLAKDIKRVAIVAPPITSVAIKMIPDQNMIVGLNKLAFIQANDKITEKVFPNYKTVDTGFVGEDFSINKEALLALKPDIILYYGEGQKKNLENIGVPIVNFFSPKLTDPKDVTIGWNNLLCEIFDLEKKNVLADEWDYSEKMSKKSIKNSTSEVVKALWVFRNTKGKLIVAGKSAFDAYAESYFDKSGIINVANQIQGTAEVSMEQVHVWNPDMIFVFQGMPANAYLKNQIDGQDWSMIKAFQDKKIYDIPKTTFSWASPCMDSPMMPLWLISKAYPEKIADKDFALELKKYYERVYGISLTDDDIESVLGLNVNR